MKKMAFVLFLALCGFSASVDAQTVKKVEHGVEKGAKEAAHGVKKAGKAVAHKTAEVAVKAEAKVTDEVSEDWVGPNGQKIYHEGNGRYYYVNSKGNKVRVDDSELKPKN